MYVLCVAMVTITEEAKDDPMKGLTMIKEVGCHGDGY